jgi:tetratricopeptide (TPR) repeat protein
MNYIKLYRYLIIGVASLSLSLQGQAARETRMQVKARELELRGDYLGAIKLYEKEQRHKNAEVASASLRGMASCYRALGNFEQAEGVYERLLRSPNKAAALYEYAEMLLRNGKYAEARKRAKEAQSADVSYADRAQRLITTCNNAEQMIKRPTRHIVTNLEELNTCYSDWGVTVYSKEEMLFSSDRPQERPGCDKGRSEGSYLSQAFSATCAEGETSLSWEVSKKLPAALNKQGAHVGPFGMAADDRELLYYTRTGKKGKPSMQTLGHEKVRIKEEVLEIYAISRAGGEWTGESKPFVHNKPGQYSVMHPCLSSDGSTLYFASDMQGGVGGVDLWYCEKDESSGKWGAPVNMGEPVNTSGNEVFPSLNDDGTLYFSSDGHPGMGGLDIFSVKKEEEGGAWATPKNMGMPVNSSADDFSFVIDPFHVNTFGRQDVVGYFSSNRIGGKGGDDIYMFVLPGAKLAEPAPETSIEAPAADSLDIDSATVDIDIDEGDAYADPDSIAAARQSSSLVAGAAGVAAGAAAAGGADTADFIPKLIAVLEPMQKPEGGVTLSGKVVNKATRRPVSKAKICATHNETRTSECHECDDEGLFYFVLEKDARYTVSGFKDGYHSTDPIRILSTVFLQEEVLEVEMQPREPSGDVQSAREVIDRTAMPRVGKRTLPREYRIQILTNWRETDWEYFTRLRRTYPQFELQYTRRDYGTGKAMRFTYGSFVNLGEARRYLRQFIKLGYTDAFIAVFEYGSQVESIYVGGSRHVIPSH